MSLTNEQRAELAAQLGIDADQIPSGQLITSGEKFDNVVEQTNQAIADGQLAAGTVVRAVLDRDVYAINDEGADSIDFTLIVTDKRGLVGLADGRGLSWFTKTQIEGLKQVLETL